MENGTQAEPFLPEPLWRDFLGLDVPYETVQYATHYGNHILQDVLDRPGQALQGKVTYLLGQGGQMLYLMPEQRVVALRSGERPQLFHSTLYGAWNSAYPPAP